MTETPDPKVLNEEAARAIRFLVIKVAIFALIPLVAGAVAAWWVLGR